MSAGVRTIGASTRRPSATAALLLLPLIAAGCGGSSSRSSSAPLAAPPRSSISSASKSGSAGIPLDLLHAAPAPARWRIVRIPTGAALHYPPGWRLVAGDAGTATAILPGPGDRIVGYLNVTPLQGGETLANWPGFRVHHNAKEGDREVKSEAVVRGVRVLGGDGTCVRDSYKTSSGARYIELACLLRGAVATSVVVGAAPPRAWGDVSPLLYRAIAGLTT